MENSLIPVSENLKQLLINATEEEIAWLKKNVIFMPDDKPTKQTYIDLLLTYRKLKKAK